MYNSVNVISYIIRNLTFKNIIMINVTYSMKHKKMNNHCVCVCVNFVYHPKVKAHIQVIWKQGADKIIWI